MNRPELTTRQLLEQWHAGDPDALDRVLARHLDWLRSHVSRRLGARLREKAETGDIVQEAMVEFLNYGPRFLPRDGAQFRALLGRIVHNVINDQSDFFRRRRREMAREQRMGSGSVVSLDPALQASGDPSKRMLEEEEAAWLRLGLELLEPEDQKVMLWRYWDRWSFREIGEQLDLSEGGARMRHRRVFLRLSAEIRALQRGHANGDGAGPE